jgi:3-deoxy-D-manno-octulosonic-acid transferase
MRFLYSVGIFFYSLGIRIAAIGNQKARLWVSGRKNLFRNVHDALSKDARPVIWFHCASLGEFEQGRPLIESIRVQHPQYKILLTFFSPSGYEVRKNYAGADVVTYMPVDTKSNAKRFIEIVNPKFAVFVKYEFWLNHLAEVRKRNIPHYLISAIFRDDQIFFRSHGNIFREALKGYTHIFTQDKNSISLLEKIDVKNVSLAGDTRFDRVAEIASNAKEIPLAAAVASTGKVLVAGSTWKDDEDILFPILEKHFRNGWKLIIAPHEISESRIQAIESAIKALGVSEDHTVRFSKGAAHTPGDIHALIIDNIGNLSSLYKYGTVAYVGGGFGKSIHNTLEAAVYGIPVVFGPKHQKFNEALGLIKCKGGFGVHSPDELGSVINSLLTDETRRAEAGRNAGTYVKENLGATDKILSVIRL